MKVIEILNFNRELLKKLHEAGIRLEDTQYIDLYSDYMNLYKNGERLLGDAKTDIHRIPSQGILSGKVIHIQII